MENKKGKRTTGKWIAKKALTLLYVFALFTSSVDTNTIRLIAEGEEEETVQVEETIESPTVEESFEPAPVETSEPTPEVTPKVTEEPTPEVAPEITPESTPEVTPEPAPEVTPEVIEENTPTPVVEETPVPSEEPIEEVIVEENYPSFLQEHTIKDVTITVEAPEGVFPEGSTLSVEEVPVYVERQVSEALDEVREEEKNVAVSYTFDIKVLKDGIEVQPKDQSKVKVSFKMVEVQNENLTTDVYHIDDKQEAITSEQVTQLDTVTEEDTAIVETDGFSLYTVEFTYNNKQYVLEGDEYVRLDEVLSYVELTGEVSSYEVSNAELFNIILGNEDGIEYVEVYGEDGGLSEYYPINTNNGDILYLVSLQPFTTEEWLKVTIDNIEYTIVVTDAIRVDENGDQVGTSVRFMQESTTIGTITDSRVIQGPLEDNFTASMPLAEIYIDDTIVNQTLWKQDQYNGDRVIAELLVDNTQGKYAGFQINMNTSSTSTDKGALDQSYGGVWYDFTKRYLNDTQTLTVAGSSANNYELFPGDIVKYTLKGMATKFDVASNAYKDYDVVITYSDILITLCQTSGTGSVNQANISSILKLIDTNMVNFTWSGGFRAGLSYNANIKVVDPDTGEIVAGSYYYPMVDIDIGRTGVGGFANLYNAADVNRYSEQVALMSNYGRPTSSGSWEQMVWIPGGNYSAAPFSNKANVTEDNYPYTCNITSKTIDGQANTLLISPGGTTTAVAGRITSASGVDKDNTFYSGFITLADNTAGGINIKGYASAPASGGVESYILTGSKIVNHKVDASSDVGGTIYTTTTGNSDGSLSGGTLLGYNEINKPFEISAATGQSVTYTMTPKGGYKLKRVWVKDGDIDIMTIINDAKETIDPSQYDLDDETDKARYEADVQAAINTALSSNPNTSEISISSLTSLGKGVYAYTFHGIQENKSIHIDWEKTDLTVTKELNPESPGATDKFKFQIKLSDTTTQETTWRVRAKQNTNKFTFKQDVNNGEPFYIVYHQTKTETVPYKYVPVEDTTDKNPYAEGWFEYLDDAYIPVYETTVVDGKTYYYKDETQTSTITDYYYHILGWDSATNSWKSHVIPATSDEYGGMVMGTTNIDAILDDSYRFIKDDNYIYNKAIYDSESADNDYLLWVRDSSITSGTYNITMIGKLEDYTTETVKREINPSWGPQTYVYMSDTENPDFQGKLIYAQNNESYAVDGVYYQTSGATELFVNVQDEHTPIYYDLETNPNGYTLDSGYTAVEGESGMYIATLPAGQRPNTADLTADGWDVTASIVGAIPDDFDLDQAMIDAGAKSVAGAVNTYEFEVGIDETFDFNGVIPMGYNYEISEILPTPTRWEFVSSTENATVSDFDGEEDVTFTNKEKRHNVTIEKQTVDDKPGTFGFTIEIYKENITPGLSKSVTVQAYKNSDDANPTYVLENNGDAFEITINGDTVTIPSGTYTYGNDSLLDGLMDVLMAMDSSANTPITMNEQSGEASTITETSITNQVQELINQEIDSFRLEPIAFNFSIPDRIEKIGYNPTTVPSGFSGGDGVFTFNLTNGESKTFTGIPYGYKYEVYELDKDGNEVAVGGNVGDGWKLNAIDGNDAGTLTQDEVVTYTNERTYELTVEKETVDDEPGTFEFEVKIYKEDAQLTTLDNMYYIGIFDYYTPGWYETIWDTVEEGWFAVAGNGMLDSSISHEGTMDNPDVTVLPHLPFKGTSEGIKIKDDYSETSPALTAEELQAVRDLVELHLAHANEPSYDIGYKTNITLETENKSYPVYLVVQGEPMSTIWVQDDGELGCVDGPETKQVYVSDYSYMNLSPYGGTPIVDEDGDGVADDGRYLFTIDSGNSVTIPEIPYGYKYEVVERQQEGWTLKEKTNDQGTIIEDTTATFTNELIKKQLTVEKVVQNPDPNNPEQTFRFKVKAFKEVNAVKAYEVAGIGECCQYIVTEAGDNVPYWVENNAYLESKTNGAQVYSGLLPVQPPVPFVYQEITANTRPYFIKNGTLYNTESGTPVEVTLQKIRDTQSYGGADLTLYIDPSNGADIQKSADGTYYYGMAIDYDDLYTIDVNESIDTVEGWKMYLMPNTVLKANGKEYPLYASSWDERNPLWEDSYIYSLSKDFDLPDVYSVVLEEGTNKYYDLSEYGLTPTGVEGEYYIDLKDGESIEMMLPYGYSYTVEEELPTDEAWELVSKVNDTGTIGEEEITSTFTNNYRVSDLTIEKQTVNDEPGTFTFNVRVWKEDTPEGETKPEAYAVFDSSDGSLTFFRDDANKYSNKQVDGTKTYYTGIETLQATSHSGIPWSDKASIVTKVVFTDPIKPISTAYWFYFMYNSNFTRIEGLEKLNTSNVTDMQNMFWYCLNLTSLDVSHFDTSKVTNMYSMFYSLGNLSSLDVSKFDTSNVTNMDYMFFGCSNLENLDLRHFDTSNVTKMAEMFSYCYKLNATLNIANMPTSYQNMCAQTGRDGGQLTLQYIDPVTSANIDTLVNTKSNGNVVNGGEGEILPIETDDETIYTFTLSNGESFVIPDIPHGYKYEVVELEQDGWSLKEKTNDNGTITDDTTATFTNELNKYDLTIQKETVNDEPGTFTFQVKAWKEGTPDTVIRAYERHTLQRNWSQSFQVAHSANLDDVRENDKVRLEIKNLRYIFDNKTVEFGDFVSRLTVANENDTQYITGSDGEEYMFRVTGEITSSGNVVYILFAGINDGQHERQVSWDSLTLYREDGVPTQYFDFSTQGAQPVAGEEGLYEFTLDAGEEKIYIDIPYGYKYEVIEQEQDGWKLKEKTKDKGTITDDMTATFVNEPVIDFTVYKEWVDDGSVTHTAEELLGIFKLYQNDIDVTTTYSNKITVTDEGSGKWSYVVSDLPKYDTNEELYEYSVKETVPSGYEVSYENGEKALDEETITNYALYDLKVWKTVSGPMGDKSKAFSFTVELWTGDTTKVPHELENLPEGVSGSGGTYTFALTHGEEVIFEDLPYYVHYKVVEEDYSSEGYRTSVDLVDGREKTGQMTSDQDVSYLNTTSAVVPTKASAGIYIPFVIMVAIGVLWYLLERWQRRETVDM